jgi:site-specific recombinase XerD
MQIMDAIDDFIVYGQQVGWSAGTCSKYRWHLDKFRLWMLERGVSVVGELSRSLVRSWGAATRERWAPATVKGAVTAVRSFLRWLIDEGLLAEDLTSALKVPRVPERVQRTITADEVGRLLAACETPVERGLTLADATTSALRNAALVALLYDSLLRASELCALSVDDIDLDAGRLVVRRGKGGKGRVAVFGPQTATMLRAWLAVRSAAPGVSAMFVAIGGNTPGSALTARGLRIIVKNLGERAGVSGVSPHAFRRGGTAQLTLSQVPTRIVQILGGWSKITMVEIYTRWLTLQTDEVQGVYNGHSPVSVARAGNGDK